MFRIISAFCLAVLFFITSSFSQSNTLLYAQNSWQISDIPYIPSYKNVTNDWEQIADDFTATSDWAIDSICVICVDFGFDLVNGFNVNIYNNNYGYPGTLVYSSETQPYSASFIYYDLLKITITLTSTAILKPGKYFISVQGISNTSSYIWSWSQAKSSYGYTAKFCSNNASWRPLNSIFGHALTDMYFELYGSAAITTEIESKETSPSKFSLEQNYPNPFNPSTKISWQSPVAGHQTLKVYDVLGNEVATLVDEYKPAGRYEVTFDGSNLSSGTYFYQLKAGSLIKTKKMILIK